MVVIVVVVVTEKQFEESLVVERLVVEMKEEQQQQQQQQHQFQVESHLHQLVYQHVLLEVTVEWTKQYKKTLLLNGMSSLLFVMDEIFTLNSRSILLAFAASPPFFAASTAFLYIARRASSSATILPPDADCTGFV